MPLNICEPEVEEQPLLIIGLGWFAIAGCVVFICSILIADAVVPDHDWMADTISDLGAGRYEFIVDIGIYMFSASLVSLALLCSHVHLGNWTWSFGMIGFALASLIIFLIGARNEYGDGDTEGVVIHIYLVYVLGCLFGVVPLLMAQGAGRSNRYFGSVLLGLSALWIVSAPFFFVLPDHFDGIYERYLGLIAIAIVITFAYLFIARGRQMRG